MTRWWRDLGFGMRLAVGGGSTSWARLLLSTLGIGLATTVLLIAGSVHHIAAARTARSNAAAYLTVEPAHAVAPLQYIDLGSDYRGRDLSVTYVRPTGPDSPVPPGVTRLPGPGQALVSPALARLLGTPAGALLRPQLPAHIVGEIGQAGLSGPQSLEYVAGFSADQVGPEIPVTDVYGFGVDVPGLQNAGVVTLLIVGVVALLIPILIMISVCSRIAGAARDRRLAAVRLVGASSAQVRRIAAAESLPPAVTGLLLGGALFLGVRQWVPDFEVQGVSVFTSDVAVPWPLLVLVVALVPVLTVGTALFALRRTVIEPLGVVRGGRPVRRRLWWRLGLTVAGVAVLVQAMGEPSGLLWTVMVVIGVSALLIGVPALLPYLLERVVGVLHGGPPAWQLAVRRLQLDSGTAARVVSGAAVVLAGAIALQSVLGATADAIAGPALGRPSGFTYVVTDKAVQGQVDAAIQHTGTARHWYPMTVVGEVGVSEPATNYLPDVVGIASCAVIDRLAGITDCRDGDVFAYPNTDQAVRPGSQVRITGESSDYLVAPPLYGHWRVPMDMRQISPGVGDWPGSVVVVVATPAAIAGVALPPDPGVLTSGWIDPTDPTAIDRLRAAVAMQPLRAAVIPLSQLIAPEVDQESFDAVRKGLLIGSLFTLSLAGISMLVLALEQVRERRRPLAMLSASGVPRSVLARSLLWQVALPVAVAVVASIGTGVLLAALVLRLNHLNLTLDWPIIGTFSAVAALLVLLVTAATLPALRGATRLSAMRTE
ncbi:MAG TPA: FtsX-like permease family protein [Pseudonocardiaceae bacterium]|nr:FtsX-like permease family protein [Pseudonocardiaceae bacterium]